MTPKEKAISLVDRFKKINAETDVCFGDCFNESITVCTKTGHGCGLWFSHAKSCAIIAVDEVIKIIPMYTGNLNPDWENWQEVKKQIESL